MTTIVVPIYNAASETERCLASVAQKTPKRVRVILINDASTDPAIGQVLSQVPEHWTIVDNNKNIGFVATANLGLTLSSSEDTVLLNADTEVTEGWLEHLEECLRSDDRIASVSPLTNHGEIASIPGFCKPNPYPDDPEDWAVACLRSLEEDRLDDGWVDVPTTVGFCMLIRRRAIQAVGYFDEQAFGLGYGEENDWCQRAIQAGWRHVLCDRAYVAHRGGSSFGPLGLAPGGQAMTVLRERYPNYEADVAGFIASDPMAKRRERIVAYYEQSQRNQQP